MGQMLNHARARDRDKARRNGTALSEPLGKRVKTIFKTKRERTEADAKAWGEQMQRAQAQARARRAADAPLAAELGGRDTSAEVVEHIPVGRVYVSPERARALQEREWIGPTQTNRLTGEVSHMRRFLRDGRYVTERFDGPAPVFHGKQFGD